MRNYTKTAAALLLTGVLTPSAHAAVVADDVVCTKCIDSSDIKGKAVTSWKLAKDSVKTEKIRKGAVTNGKIAVGAVNSASVQDNSLTADDLADGSVTTLEIATGAVSSDKIADGAVTGVKIADGTVTGSDIATGAITGIKIADGSITAADIANGAIAALQIADETVTGTDILNGSITGSDIADDSITSSKLSNEAGIDFYNGTASASAGNNKIDLSSATWTTARSITLTIPAAGNVTCIGSGYADWDSNTWSEDVLLGWTTSATGTPVGVQVLNLPGTSDNLTYIPMTSVYTFPVTAGTVGFHLRAKISSGLDTDVDFFFDAGSTCMYFPTNY
ncbi:MAG: hypothetical protein GXP10_00655 [Gammaproteobacteria bacterium]|nr:hypothetical protein [Gammaproteobacteria bacterium]